MSRSTTGWIPWYAAMWSGVTPFWAGTGMLQQREEQIESEGPASMHGSRKGRSDGLNNRTTGAGLAGGAGARGGRADGHDWGAEDGRSWLRYSRDAAVMYDQQGEHAPSEGGRR